jgi:hypothetical protein
MMMMMMVWMSVSWKRNREEMICHRTGLWIQPPTRQQRRTLRQFDIDMDVVVAVVCCCAVLHDDGGYVTTLGTILQRMKDIVQ